MAKLDSIVIFADCGVTTHQAQYRSAGASAARHGARIICVARQGQWPRAVIDSALAGGGNVTVFTGPLARGLGLPTGVVIEMCASDAEAGVKAVQMGQVVVGLPGGIDTMAALYASWTGAGGAASKRPIGLLNRDKAFEVVKGFSTDIAGPGRGSMDGVVQFSDNFDDLLNRLMRLV